MMKRYAQLSILTRKYQLNYIVNKTLLYEYLVCEQRVCIKYNYNFIFRCGNNVDRGD